MQLMTLGLVQQMRKARHIARLGYELADLSLSEAAACPDARQPDLALARKRRNPEPSCRQELDQPTGSFGEVGELARLHTKGVLGRKDSGLLT